MVDVSCAAGAEIMFPSFFSPVNTLCKRARGWGVVAVGLPGSKSPGRKIGIGVARVPSFVRSHFS